MKASWMGQGLGIATTAILILSVTQGSAAAARNKTTAHRSHVVTHTSLSRANHAARTWHPTWQRSALQCVPFARENSGIELTGNAGTWWNSASGLYERGARPEVGSILNFRSTGRMRMGHVAVVTNVITPRHIEIDHANWGAPGRISRNIDVVDVSPANDWTAVRVALSNAEDYGSAYPTYGFIYDRPDHGVMVANTSPMAAPTLSAPSAIALASEQIDLSAAPEEVAEADSDDNGSPAPRYSAHRRATHAAKSGLHAASSRGRGYSPFPTASTFRVSTRSAGPAKPVVHKTAKRRF